MTTEPTPTAVVTGVTSGIGLALAQALLTAGYTVVGIGRDPDRLHDLKLGPRFQPVVMDLADPDARQHGIAAIQVDHKAIDLIVNNAGECVFDAPLTLRADHWRRIFEINLIAAIDLLQNLLPHLGSGGHIVNLSSVTANFLPAAAFAPYALTKSAIADLTVALRLELNSRGIKVTSVTPGLVDTPIYSKVDGFAAMEAILHQQIPQWLEPGDVADAIMWILAQPAHVGIGDLTVLPLRRAR